MTDTAKEMQIEMMRPLDIIAMNNKPRGSSRHYLRGHFKLSEVRLHVKAYPYKYLDSDCVASKRLYLFDSIKIRDAKGTIILNHELPEVIELDENYSIKISTILHDDMVVDGLDITLTKNNRPFEITELYIQYVETDEELTKNPFHKIFHRLYNVIPDELGQKYQICMKNYNILQTHPEFKFYRIIKENDIYYITKYNYENDIEWILVDDKEEINKNIKKLEEYTGHKLLIKIKPTSNVLLLAEDKYPNY